MNTENISLLSMIDDIDMTVMESEFQVMDSMQQYYSKCVSILEHVEDDDAVEGLSVFTESAITDKLKSVGEKAGKMVDKAEEWSKSETKGGKIKKVLIGLIKSITGIIVKIIRGFQKLRADSIIGTHKRTESSINAFNDELEKLEKSFGNTTVSESYVDEYEYIQEGFLSAAALQYIANVGMKSAKNIAKNIADPEVHGIDILKEKKKKSLAERIREIDRMSPQEKAQLITKTNKLIDSYCDKAAKVSNVVLDEIEAVLSKEFDKKFEGMDGQQVFEKIGEFIDGLSESVYNAMVGAIKMGDTAFKAVKAGITAVASNDTAMKVINVAKETSAYMMTQVMKIKTSEMFGTETAAALTEIVNQGNFLAKIKTVANYMVLTSEGITFEKKFKNADELFDADVVRNRKLLSKNDGDYQKLFAKGDKIDGGYRSDFSTLNNARDNVDVFKLPVGTTKPDVVEATNETRKVAKQISDLIDDVFKVKEIKRRKQITKDKEQVRTAKDRATRRIGANGYNNKFVSESIKYHEERIEYLESSYESLNNDGKELLDHHKKQLHVAQRNYEKTDERMNALISFAGELKDELKNLSNEYDSLEQDIDPKLLESIRVFEQAKEELTKMDSSDFTGLTPGESVHRVFSILRKFNKSLIVYSGSMAKHMMKSIIQLDSIQGTLAELGDLLSKYGEARLTDFQNDRETIKNQTGREPTEMFEFFNTVNSFIAQTAKVTGFCLTKCVTNPTNSKKLMDKQIATTIRGLNAVISNQSLKDDYPQLNDNGKE